jgi:hypothetical protein
MTCDASGDSIMVVRNWRRIDLFCPEYKTDTTISIDENESGQPQLHVHYERGGDKGRKDFTAALPTHWGDQDISELLVLDSEEWTDRGWPAWEIPSRDHGSIIIQILEGRKIAIAGRAADGARRRL